jgi:adenylate cyclase
LNPLMHDKKMSIALFATTKTTTFRWRKEKNIIFHIDFLSRCYWDQMTATVWCGNDEIVKTSRYLCVSLINRSETKSTILSAVWSMNYFLSINSTCCTYLNEIIRKRWSSRSQLSVRASSYTWNSALIWIFMKHHLPIRFNSV